MTRETNSGTAASNPDGDLRRQCMNWRLTTAEITYHMPDYPTMLQTFLWQKLDLPPRFPELRKFLAFWENDGQRHFEIEEELLLDALPAQTPGWAELVARVHRDHAEIRARAASLADGLRDLDSLHRLGDASADLIESYTGSAFYLSHLDPDAARSSVRGLVFVTSATAARAEGLVLWLQIQSFLGPQQVFPISTFLVTP